MMSEPIVVIHRIPGRMRLRIPGRRGDAHYFEQFSDTCGRVDGVSTVRANPGTASVMVEFAGSEGQFLEQLQEGCDVRIDQPVPRGRSRNVPRTAGAENSVHLVAGRDINPMFMTAAALATLGVIQLARGKILAPSVTLMWYAVDAFRLSRQDA